MSLGRLLLTVDCVLSGCAFWLASPCAVAQAPAPVVSETREPTDTYPTIVLLFEPDEADASRLISAIESHLVGLPVRVALEPAPHTDILTWLESGHARARARQALGVLAIDTSQGAVWRLFFLDTEGAPALIRRLRSSPEHAPLDEAGVAVRLLVEALLDSKEIEHDAMLPGNAAPDVTPPVAKPSESQSGGSPKVESASDSKGRLSTPDEVEEEAAARRRSRARDRPVLVFLGPVGTSWLDQKPLQLGAAAGIGMGFARGWSIAAGYTWYPSQTYRVEVTDLTLRRHPVVSYVAFTPRSGLSPRFSLGVTVDAVLRETVATREGYRSTSTTTTWSWGVLGAVGAVAPLGTSFVAGLDLGAQINAARIEFVAQGQSRDVLLATRRASPFLSLYIGLRL